MPVGNRIALFGFGRIGRIVSNSLVTPGVNTINKDLDFQQLTKVIMDDKCVSLVEIYKNVKHRYYPESDYFGKFSNKLF